jgi:hypothetical protein
MYNFYKFNANKKLEITDGQNTEGKGKASKNQDLFLTGEPEAPSNTHGVPPLNYFVVV